MCVTHVYCGAPRACPSVSCPQVTGVALTTVAFAIATREFDVPIKQVLVNHGNVGMAVLVLVYLQVI